MDLAGKTPRVIAAHLDNPAVIASRHHDRPALAFRANHWLATTMHESLAEAWSLVIQHDDPKIQGAAKAAFLIGACAALNCLPRTATTALLRRELAALAKEHFGH